MKIQITELELRNNPSNTTSCRKGAYLPSRSWKFEEIKVLMERNLTADFSNCVGLGINPMFLLNTFVAISSHRNEGGTRNLESAQHYKLKLEGHDLVLDGDSIGDILANYEHGGHQAIRYYLEERYERNVKMFE